MADLLIYWDEIEDGAFPDCCMTCGDEETELVPRYLQARRWLPGVLGIMLQKSMTVELPFCPRHVKRPWTAWGRTDAHSFTEEGIWMRNLSPIFVEEMEAYRDEEDDYENRRKRKKHRRRRGRKRSRDRDDDDREPLDERRRPMPQSSGGGMVALVILLVILVPIVLMGGCCVANVIINGGKFEVKGGPGPPPFKR